MPCDRNPFGSLGVGGVSVVGVLGHHRVVNEASPFPGARAGNRREKGQWVGKRWVKLGILTKYCTDQGNVLGSGTILEQFPPPLRF